MNEEQIESRSLLDLETIMRGARRLGIRMILIGGYAVTAHTHGYRYTKDIDLAIDGPAIGKLTGLLNSLGYHIRNTEFGLAGSKRLNQGSIDLHISVGKIHDISTGYDYPVNAQIFESAKRLLVKGYYSKALALRTPVVDLDTLLILKLMPVGRPKDAVDLLSLLLDKQNEVNLISLAYRAKHAGLGDHLLTQVRDYARKLRQGELDRIWFDATASRLPYVKKREMGRFLARLANILRQQ